MLPIIRANLNRESAVMTDAASRYKSLSEYTGIASPYSVRHEDYEYVRYEGDRTVHTNTVEGYYSIFKRGMKGVYQHGSEKHLHRYLAEFDFRYSHRVKLGYGDEARANRALKGIVGKRIGILTSPTPGKAGRREARKRATLLQLEFKFE